MANWYISYTDWLALPVFAVSTAYSVGQLVRENTGVSNPAARHVFRCTTAGTSAGTEAAWSRSVIGTSTTTQGTAVFTLVTGLEAYGWAAAGGSIDCFNNTGVSSQNIGPGDTVYLADTHVDGASNPGPGTLSNNDSCPTPIISVNRSGSFPPVIPTDYLPGASFQVSGTITVNNVGLGIWYGVTFRSTGGGIRLAFSNERAYYLKDCTLWLDNAGANTISASNPYGITLDNSSLRFGASTQKWGSGSYNGPVEWVNSTALHASSVQPTYLFNGGDVAGMQVHCKGVDFSSVTGSVVEPGTTSSTGSRFIFQDCKAPATGRWFPTGALGEYSPYNTTNDTSHVDVINSSNANSVVTNEHYQNNGRLTTSTTHYASGGAEMFDNPVSHELLTYYQQANAWSRPLLGFPIYYPIESADVGVAKTITVECLLEDLPGYFTPQMGPGLGRYAYTNGGLTVEALATSQWNTRTNPFLTAGKYYAELFVDSGTSSTNIRVGLTTPWALMTTVVGSAAGSCAYLGNNSQIIGTRKGNPFTNPTSTTAGSAWSVTGTRICIAVDFDNSLMWCRIGAGNWNNNASADPATGVGGFDFSPCYSKTGPGAGMALAVALYAAIGNKITLNPGTSAFTHSVPSGFSAWNTATGKFTNEDLSLELEYLGNSSYPLGTTEFTRPEFPVSTRTALTTSSQSWSGSLTGGQAYKLQKTFTPQRKGLIQARVRMGRVGMRAFYNPQLDVS